MKNLLFAGMLTCLFACIPQAQQQLPREAFVRVNGPDLITPDGQKLLIRGTNLGNWMNPEGYMFSFRNINSPGRINQALCEMVGPDFMAEFWKTYKDNYITKDDIFFLKKAGCNTIRLPFHYKLFTDEDYMGLTVDQDGFRRMDELVSWCKEAGLWLILDMHDAPGGQTGDNIDDSYGYPWLLDSEASQKLFVDIWTRIADHYKNEPTILGYELCNEPIAPYFENVEELNAKLEPLYKRALSSIRTVDPNHVVLFGGSQWNSNFKPLSTDTSFDDNVMYTCHRYGGEASADAIRSYIDFRDQSNRPMYMGEIGHNTDEWMTAFVAAMEANNIGWNFWPYKKMKGSSFVTIKDPADWDVIINFVEADRSSYKAIRDARPDQVQARRILTEYLELCKFGNNEINESYIRALGLNPER